MDLPLVTTSDLDKEVELTNGYFISQEEDYVTI